MRFLKEKKIKKRYLIISDLHLGAGHEVDGQVNYLEDFHADEELVDFLDFYAQDDKESSDVELIINGDFLDFLAIPFIETFDDEFWSEDAAHQKFDIIYNAHPEVFKALVRFVETKGRSLTYIIGNHDAELCFETLRDKFINIFPENIRDRVKFITNNEGKYIPCPEVAIVHGHEYELAHNFDLENSILHHTNGRKYFIPPWGSYYVLRLVNKFKEERPYINQVRPIKRFLINGLIYDTLFTLRFILANIFYFIMVRFFVFWRQRKNMTDVFQAMAKDLDLFEDEGEYSKEFFEKHPDVRVMCVGHTHNPMLRPRSDGRVFVNSGCWTAMYHLDPGRMNGNILTYVKIDSPSDGSGVVPRLIKWEGRKRLPYQEV